MLRALERIMLAASGMYLYTVYSIVWYVVIDAGIVNAGWRWKRIYAGALGACW